MKIKYLTFFLFVVFFVSCSQRQKYELMDLSNPILDEWFASFKLADNNFSVENFKILLPSETEHIEYESKWCNYEPDTSVLYIYSPNLNFYIDLDFYTIIEDGIYIGSDIDTKVDLIDIQKKKKIEIINTGSSEWVDDAFWINDSVFVLLQNSEYWDKSKNTWGEGCIPSISVWTAKGEKLKVFQYDGNINYPLDSPFYKRLKRKGIMIHNN